MAHEKEDHITWTEIRPPEISRTYYFPQGGGGTFRVDCVNRLRVSHSGTHYLETLKGKRVIVAAGWIGITIILEPGADWSV